MLDLFSYQGERVQAYLRRWGLKIVLRYADPEKGTRKHIHAPRNVGELVADAVVGFMGSWRFIIGQTVVVVAWLAMNAAVFVLHWDPYPFILLNLLFSTQAAYASPLILMAANRTAAKDALRDDHEADEVEQLFIINQQQLEILKTLHELQEKQHGSRRKVG